MYFRSFCFCLAAFAGFSQQVPTAVSSDTVVATVNGQKFTIRDFEQLVANMTPQMREAAMKQPRAVLEQYALFQNILAEAEKSKLDQQSPYKERIDEARRQILVQAQISDKSNSIVVSPEDVKKAYEDNRARYAEARAKVIFISQIKDERSLGRQGSAEARTGGIEEARRRNCREVESRRGFRSTRQGTLR